MNLPSSILLLLLLLLLVVVVVSLYLVIFNVLSFSFQNKDRGNKYKCDVGVQTAPAVDQFTIPPGTCS